MALPVFPCVAIMAGLALSAVCLWRKFRQRFKAVAVVMLPLAFGFWLVHGGLIQWLTGAAVSFSPERIQWAAELWLRILSVVSASQLWLEYVPPPLLIRSLFASSLPAWFGFLLASPLLLVEQIKARLSQIQEAQLARGVPVFGSFKERISSLTALMFPLVLGLLNDLPTRSAALDMKGFGLFPHRTSLRSGGHHISLRTEKKNKCSEAVLYLKNVYFTSSEGREPLLEIPELRLQPGERLLLTGGNGSGKSTLAALLSGCVPEYRSGTVIGDVSVLDEPVVSRSTLGWSPYVQFVQQIPHLSLSGCTFTVYEEVAFGPENLALPPDEIRARVDQALAVTGMEHLKNRNPSHLSGGEAQKLAIASALAMAPRLLVLDEAFTRIHPADVPVLAERLEKWSNERGAAVIFLEQRRSLFAPWCGVSGNFQDGRFLQGDPFPAEGECSGRISRSVFPRVTEESAPLLRIEKLCFRWKGEEQPLFRSLEKTIGQGERTALVGPNGAGKSTLMRLCAGLLPSESGTVFLNGLPVASMNPKERARKIGFLFQDAERQIFHSTVADEVLFSLRYFSLSREEKMERLETALAAAGLAGKGKKHPLDLNSAERRMMAVASLSVAEPELFLLDEPTRDFDPFWQDLFETWLAGRTGSVLAVSHDFDFVSRLFPRVWLLEDGAIRADASPENVLALSAGRAAS